MDVTPYGLTFMLTEWFRPAGVELTRILPWEEEAAIPKDIKKQALSLHPDNKYLQDEYINNKWKINHKVNPLVRKGDHWAKTQPTIRNFGTDPYCVEVSSSILNDWRNLKVFFTRTDAYCNNLGLLRHSEEICGTGGHIHLSITNSNEALLVKRFMANHPEAMYAFCHPCDTNHGIENQYKEEIDNNPTEWYEKNLYNWPAAMAGKDGPIAYRDGYQTVEFRMFDVAQTWEMQEEHMAFAQAFTRYAISHPQAKVLYLDQVEKRTVKQHIANFEKLIKLLDLPWNRYKWYVKNIQTRFQFIKEDQDEYNRRCANSTPQQVAHDCCNPSIIVVHDEDFDIYSLAA